MIAPAFGVPVSDVVKPLALAELRTLNSDGGHGRGKADYF